MTLSKAPSLTISISGVSSSGKSTLSYQLQNLFSPPPKFILQLDDFCKEDEFLPLRPNGLPDADAVVSMDMATFKSALLHCKETGRLLDGFSSWQNPKDIAEARAKALATIGTENSEEAGARVRAVQNGREVGIVEGFLLYQDEEIRKMVDIKLFLRTSKAVAKARRMKRPGYGDPDTKDFWRTEEYFEECVWANYVKENGWLFEDKDVEREPNHLVCTREEISVQPNMDTDARETFEWAVRAICKALDSET